MMFMPLPDDLAGPMSREWSRLAPLVTDVHWVASTPSTMDLVQTLAGSTRDGLVVVADEQTAGRGRRGRIWASPPGAGLYFSILSRPPAQAIGLLTLAAGVGVTDGVLASTGLHTELKWPNDVLVGRRKLAGILAEGIGLGTPDQAVVLGVGLNVSAAAYPPDVATRATSLETELGRDIDRGEVLAQTLVATARWYRALLEARYDEVLQAWRAAAPSAIGTTVTWTTPQGSQTGVTAGIDESGALLVRTPHGTERLIAGEVTWA
jgi:BirA family transcriptional regulator, biotin operon repressor / biotin---[acetyl-CoA-carboxylase] ligase